MSTIRIMIPIALLALGACAPVDRGFGESVRLNNLRQTVNPEGMEASADAPREGGSGARADMAIGAYEKGSVKQPTPESSTSASGGGGGSSN